VVVRGASGGVVGPPRASISPQLLHGEGNLLLLCVVQEPKLGVYRTKQVVGLQKLSCLNEDRWMSSHKVSIGGQSWSWDVPSPIATMSRVGHELS
jgi:hypothetical protein